MLKIGFHASRLPQPFFSPHPYLEKIGLGMKGGEGGWYFGLLFR